MWLLRNKHYLCHWYLHRYYHLHCSHPVVKRGGFFHVIAVFRVFVRFKSLITLRQYNLPSSCYKYLKRDLIKI